MSVSTQMMLDCRLDCMNNNICFISCYTHWGRVSGQTKSSVLLNMQLIADFVRLISIVRVQFVQEPKI